MGYRTVSLFLPSFGDMSFPCHFCLTTRFRLESSELERSAIKRTPAGFRLQEICQQVAKEMRDCANTYDTYQRKNLVIQCLRAPLWEAHLADFANKFSKRQAELQVVMSTLTFGGMVEVKIATENIEAEVKGLRFVPFLSSPSLSVIQENVLLDPSSFARCSRSPSRQHKRKCSRSSRSMVEQH